MKLRVFESSKSFCVLSQQCLAVNCHAAVCLAWSRLKSRWVNCIQSSSIPTMQYCQVASRDNWQYPPSTRWWQSKFDDVIL